MSTRNTILEGIKDCLKNISDVSDVVRKFVFFDDVHSFPLLMVLGGDEIFDDQLGNHTISKMAVKVAGYAKSSQDPEKEQCILLENVLKCLDDEEYNPYKAGMRPIKMETDEGTLHAMGDGVSLFVLELELLYRFDRSNP